MNDEHERVVHLMEGKDRIIPCTHLMDGDGLSIKVHAVSIDDDDNGGARVLFDLIWTGEPDRPDGLIQTIIIELTEYRTLEQKPDETAIIAAAASKLRDHFLKLIDTLGSIT